MLSDIERKSYIKRAINLGVHSCLQELFAYLSNMVNAVMLSVISQMFLSASTLATQFINIYVYSMLGLSLTVLMLFNQYYGKKDFESLQKIFHISFLFSLIISFIFFISSFLFSTQIMNILTSDKELALYGSEYLKYFSFVFLFNSFSKIYMMILKSEDKSHINTIASTIAILTNIFASFILIYGFIIGKGIGIKGAAIASSLGAFVETLILFIYCICFSQTKFSIKQLFNIDSYFGKEIFKYSVPSILCKFAWSTAYALQISIIGHMSRNIIDSFSSIKMISNIPCSIFAGFSIAFGVEIGHELGKGNISLAKDYAAYGLKWTIKVAILTISTLIIIGGGYIFVTKPSPDMAYACIIMIGLFAYLQFSGTYVNYFNQAIFSTGGEVEFLALMDIVNMWIFILPLGLLFYYVLHLPEYFVLFLLFSIEIDKLPFLISHYKKNIWARDLTINPWFLPLEGSFIDKYKRDFKLRLNISLTDFFTKRFENTTDFIFSISENNLSKSLEELQAYLENIKLDKITSYKTILAIEGIFSSSKELTKLNKKASHNFNCDVGIKLKNNKIRIIYYDNGSEIKEILQDESKVSIMVLKSIVDKLEYKRILNLNKIILRINRAVD